MPKWGYTITELDPERTAKASGRELRISHKAAREVCNSIRGLQLNQAKDLLRQVILKKRAIPYRKYNKKLGHRHGLENAFTGRYPVKAAQKILEVLEGAESNAEFKGLDVEKTRVIHASAFVGMKIKRMIPRAFGRSSPKTDKLCHLEIVLEETKEKEANP